MITAAVGPQSDCAGVPVVGAVGRTAVVALVVEAVYFCLPGVVLCGEPLSFHWAWGFCVCSLFCLSWFLDFLFCLWGKLGECVCWLHPLVLAVLDVSPFEVDVALEMNAQQ